MSRRVVAAEALPILRRAVGREIAVVYVPEKRPRRRRAVPVEPLPLFPAHQQILPFPEVDGRGRREIELLSEPVSVVCRPVRLWLPSSIDERIIVLDIAVGNVSCLTGPSRGVPGDLFSTANSSLASLNLPTLLPGQRVRVRVQNVSRDQRRKLRVRAAVVVDLPPPPSPPVPLSFVEPGSLGAPLPFPFGSPYGTFKHGSVPFSADMGGPPNASAFGFVGPPSACPSRPPDHEVDTVGSLSADGPWYVGCRVRVRTTGAVYALERWLQEDGAPNGGSTIASPLPACVWSREVSS